MNEASACVIIARSLAVIYLAVAAGAFSRKNYFSDIMSGLSSNMALLYLSGLLATLIGIVIIHAHNAWTADWTVLITIVGWAALIKGVVIVACPDFFRARLAFWSLPIINRILPWLCLALGALFAYCGFLA